MRRSKGNEVEATLIGLALAAASTQRGNLMQSDDARRSPFLPPNQIHSRRHYEST